jgi:two-component system, NarL family, nitrate/nitrite response regulator NarL
MATDGQRHIDVLLGDLGVVISLGLRQVLRTDPCLSVIGESQGQVALEADVVQLAPDVVILGEAGVARRSVPRRLRNVRPTVGIVVLAHWPTHAYTSWLLAAGVAACIPTDAPASVILDAIRLAAEGRQVLAREPSRSYASDFAGMDQLTRREREVLELLSSRHSNNEIAQALHISLPTARTHIRHIFNKLGVNSRKKLVGIEPHR